MILDDFDISGISDFREHFNIVDFWASLRTKVVLLTWVNQCLDDGLDESDELLLNELLRLAEGIDSDPKKSNPIFDFAISVEKQNRNDNIYRIVCSDSQKAENFIALGKIYQEINQSYGINNSVEAKAFVNVVLSVLLIVYSVSLRRISSIELKTINELLIEDFVDKGYILKCANSANMSSQTNEKCCITTGKIAFADELLVWLDNNGILHSDTSLYKTEKMYSFSADKDTGIIGIGKDGKLINYSALNIPMVDGRTVSKALISKDCYAVLLNDGSVIHNLETRSVVIPSNIYDIFLKQYHMAWIDKDNNVYSTVFNNCGKARTIDISKQHIATVSINGELFFDKKRVNLNNKLLSTTISLSDDFLAIAEKNHLMWFNTANIGKMSDRSFERAIVSISAFGNKCAILFDDMSKIVLDLMQ